MGERELHYADALNEALDICMRRDERVILMGLGAPDVSGIFGSTTGLLEKHGPERVFETPISENAMTGVLLGAGLVGIRPVMTHVRQEFAMPAMEQIVNQAAKWHYMFGGQASVPMVMRMIIGRGWGQGSQHSQSMHAWFAHVPGLRVLLPATPYDAKGLLISAIEDENPVVILEHRWLYKTFGPVPEGHYRVPIGEPNLIHPGKDVTIVSSSYMTLEATKAVRSLADDGVEAELIDLRSIQPLDDAMILESVRKTGRLVVCDHANRNASFAAEIITRVVEQALDTLKAPPVRITLPHSPTPTTRALSNYYYPTDGHIVAAAKRLMGLPSEDPFASVAPEDTLDVPDPSFTGPF
ncbi:MAG: alpha-ketoacid dehydrogenase subunit beta [bacterium]|nr:alpha-ketoacid dehydrogenase subunit beta [bacterium]